MIIVSVVMAAAILVGWNLYISDVEKAPNVGLTAKEADDRLSVAQAEPGADWYRIGIRAADSSGSATSLHAGDATNVVGAPATADGANILNTLVRVNQSPLTIGSSDTLAFCAVGGASDVTVDVIDVEANRKLGSWHFDTVRPC